MDIKSHAEALSDMFLADAEAVRGYWRAHAAGLSDEDSQSLQDKIHQFEALHDEFAAEAIAVCLTNVQDKLDELTKLTSESKDVLKKLNRLQQVTEIATAVLDAGAAAACGDFGGMAGKLGTLAEALAKSKQPAAAAGAQPSA